MAADGLKVAGAEAGRDDERQKGRTRKDEVKHSLPGLSSSNLVGEEEDPQTPPTSLHPSPKLTTTASSGQAQWTADAAAAADVAAAPFVVHRSRTSLPPGAVRIL